MNLADRTFGGSPALHYVEGADNGPPLLLLHGLARAWQDYEPLLPALLPHWHVFALDHRGHGDSERTPGRYLVTDYVEDVARFVTNKCRAGVTLYGHSLGAMVALAVAAELPEPIAGIILEDPPFHTMGRRIAQTPWLALFTGLREVARRGGDIKTLAVAIAAVRVPPPVGGCSTLGELRFAESLRFSAECLARLDPETYSPVIEGRWLDGYEERRLFPKVRCPVFLLQGDPACGGALTDKDAGFALAACPLARRAQFPRTGHLIHREQPDAVSRVIADFATSLAVRKNAHRIPTLQDSDR